MKTYKVKYSGNSTRFQKFEIEINAESERNAVKQVYAHIMNENYFQQEDGSILDCNDNEIASASDATIEYDGGCFFAEILEEE